MFPGWDDAVKNYFMVISDGMDRLEWHVRHGLVPTTADEFAALKKAQEGDSNG